MTAGAPILIVIPPSDSGTLREALSVGPGEGTAVVQPMDNISAQRRPASKTARFRNSENDLFLNMVPSTWCPSDTMALAILWTVSRTSPAIAPKEARYRISSKPPHFLRELQRIRISAYRHGHQKDPVGLSTELVAQDRIKANHHHVLLCTQVKRRSIIIAVVSDLWADREDIVKVMSPPKRMAGIVAREP